jgi:hypothetical protein
MGSRHFWTRYGTNSLAQSERFLIESDRQDLMLNGRRGRRTPDVSFGFESDVILFVKNVTRRVFVTLGRIRKSRKIGIPRQEFQLPSEHSSLLCCILPTVLRAR